MDLFAVILVTITATTICGICLFIFVCAVQPKFFRRLRGRVNQDSDSLESSSDNQDESSVKSLNLPDQSKDLDAPESNDRDRTAYLKSLERSLRTGRRIQEETNDEINDETNNESISPPGRFKFIRNFINKYIRRTTSDTD